MVSVVHTLFGTPAATNHEFLGSHATIPDESLATSADHVARREHLLVRTCEDRSEISET